MSRRFPAWWAVIPLLVALAYQSRRIIQSPDLPDTDGHFGLIGAMISTVLLFGGWPRKHWIWAGLTTAVVVLAIGVANAGYVVWLHEAGGVPRHWLLELGAVFTVLALPGGLIAGATSAVVCSKEWLRR